MTDIIQSLWIGSRLSTMEILSINSFVKNGNVYHLYVYEDVGNVPDGAVIKDGNEILPASDIFAYGPNAGAGNGSLAAFSNVFRYELLDRLGGFWVDTDVVCLRKFDFEAEPYVFAGSTDEVGGWVLKVPPGSKILAFYKDACDKKDLAQIKYSEIGPRLVGSGVEKFGLHNYVKPARTFTPFPWRSFRTVFNPNYQLDRGQDVYAVHLWHEQWRQYHIDKDGSYDPLCLYERLKEEFLP